MPKIGSGCPGQDSAYLKDFNTNIIPCPSCGCEIEFFADEKKVRCNKCGRSVFKLDFNNVEYKDGKVIFKDLEKNCLDWCGGCLDAKDYKDIEKNKERLEQKRRDFKMLMKNIDKQEIEVIYFFIEAFKKSINHTKLIDPVIFDILKKKNPCLFIKTRNYYMDFLKG